MDIAPILIKQERLAASERTREKLAKLKAEGKRLGRPRSSEVKRRLIACGEGRNIEGGMQDCWG